MAHLIASSPLSSPPPSQSFSRQSAGHETTKCYRSTKELPFELAQHVQTYYEENLFTQAYTFLLSIISNSASSLNRSAPITVPQSSHLALAATISVHPLFTTRITSREKWEQANSALRLLRLIHKTAGPVNSDFLTAFTFRRYDARHSRGVRFDDENDHDHRQDSNVPVHDLNTPYFSAQSLWTRAEDFWHLAGWAFNCACLPGMHTQRWLHYHLLLDFLIEVLETDWEIRNESNSAEESLLWQYIELSVGGHARERRILRAIFADGTTRATNEFRAIFQHELKEPVKEETGFKKREVDVNVEKEIYGDYLVQDDSDISDEGGESRSVSRGAGRPSKRLRTRTPSARRVTPRNSSGSLRSDYETGGEDGPTSNSSTNTSSSTLGDHHSLGLRVRLLKLLTYISSHPTLTSTSPTTFPDLEDLLTLFVEFIKPLPLPVFASFVLPSSGFDTQTTVLLAESLLQRLLETSAPTAAPLTQETLQMAYLPFAAARNSVDANARVAVVLEGLVRAVVGSGEVTRTKELREAVKKGVQRRLERAAEWRRKGTGTGNGKASAKEREETLAWNWLVESGERLADVLSGGESG